MTQKELEEQKKLLENDRYQGSMIGGSSTNTNTQQTTQGTAQAPSTQIPTTQVQTSPSGFVSPWSQQLSTVAEQIMNRPAFEYKIDQDKVYQQLKDQYIEGGRRAMLDTLGQTQAMTGGYGNSYALAAGQQAYQGYMQGLTDRIPDLYQVALDQYLREGDALQDQYSLLGSLDSRAYDRYMADLNYQYQLDRDQMADQQWQQSFDEDKRRYDQEWYTLHPEQKPGYVAPSSSGGTVYWNPGTVKKDDKKDNEPESTGGTGGATGTGKNIFDNYVSASMLPGYISPEERAMYEYFNGTRR